ncbi:uncharacterized protein LOC135307699 [Passer domesticus]|uniref:uncharacterized protein LOC135307699 n=1 Tax=Passer domesticus TaxID=48849 RepID=UPI0030FE400D
MQDTTEKISLEPSKQTRQVLKKMLQGGQEMKGEPVQMEAFPGGSSGSVPASAEGREAMPGTGTGDEVSGRASPSAWMNKVLKPLEPPADVSTGRTSPAPSLDVALKPSSHHRSTPTGKIQDTTDKISLEPSKQMRQELKEPLQTRQEMDIVLQWKLAFLEGSTPSLVPAPVAGRKAIPDTGTGTADWEAGKDSPLAWRSEVVKPSEHSADVSAGTTSPTPTLDAALKPSSHHRGPTTGETKGMAGKKFQDPLEVMWQMLKECLQRRQEMKGEPVQKEALPGGSSGSVPASAPGREAMPGTGTGDEVSGRASPSAWMNKVLKPLEPPADVSTGRTSPAPSLDVALKPSSHHRSTPTGKIQDTTDKISLEPSKQMRQELKEALQTRQELDIVLQWKLAFLKGSTPSLVPAPVAGRKAIPDTGTGTADWDAGKDSPLAWRSEVVKPSEHSADVSAGTTSPTPTLDAALKPSSHHRGETKGMAGKKFQDPLEVMWQMLKECLQRRQEMKGEPVQKEALPGGSSGSVPASAAGREAMPGTGTGDEGVGKASPSAWTNKVLKPLQPPTDVSTGKTSPASPAATLDAALKPSSHLRGTPTGKIQDTTDKISLEPSKQMRQELKEPLQTREEMDIVLQWKVVFLEGSTPSSVRAPAAGRKAMADTGTGTADWDAGKDSPLAWRSEVVKPSGHSAGVSAGTTSPTPTLDAAQKPSSHGRGPLTGKTKDMAGRKFQDPLEIMWQMLKERLQRRQEIKGEPAEKEAFPGGSSGCMPASAPGREAMPGTGTGDEGAGKASPSAWMNKVLKPLEPPADVSTGKTSPASPAATLDAELKPSSHLRGTPTGKIQDATDKISLEPSKQMRQELKEPLQTREEMDIVLQWKVVFLEGSTPSSVPAPAAGRKAMADTGTGTADWDAGKDSPLAWRSEVVKPSEHSAGVSAGTTSPTPTLDAAQKASSHGRGE